MFSLQKLRFTRKPKKKSKGKSGERREITLELLLVAELLEADLAGIHGGKKRLIAGEAAHSPLLQALFVELSDSG